jgi:hypothetical protein
MIINVHYSACEVHNIFFQILIKFEISRQIFEKYSNIKFHENPSNGSWVVLCGRKDRESDGRHDEAKSSFRNFAKVLENYQILNVEI